MCDNENEPVRKKPKKNFFVERITKPIDRYKNENRNYFNDHDDKYGQEIELVQEKNNSNTFTARYVQVNLA